MRLLSHRESRTVGMAWRCRSCSARKPVSPGQANREIRAMKLGEIMTRNVDSVPPETTLQEAAQRMQAEDIGFLPVCQNNRMVGPVTDRDSTVRGTATGIDSKSTTIPYS